MGAAPGGQSIVVEGVKFLTGRKRSPWRKENFENRMKVKVTNDPHRYDTGEPELQCYRPGRAAR